MLETQLGGQMIWRVQQGDERAINVASVSILLYDYPLTQSTRPVICILNNLTGTFLDSEPQGQLVRLWNILRITVAILLNRIFE